MKQLFLIAILLNLSSIAIAQRFTDTVKVYYNGKWEEIVDKKKISKKQYTFYRIARKAINKGWYVQDYFAFNNALQMEGLYLDDSLTIKDGKFYRYFYNGNIEEEITYNKNNPVGLHREYSINGQLLDSSRYKSTGMPFHKAFHWDEDGRLIAYGEYDMKGSGAGYVTYYHKDSTVNIHGKFSKGHLMDSIWTCYHKNGKIAFKGHYKAGELLKWECYDKNGNIQKEKCDTALVGPSPMYDVYKFIAKNAIMPDRAKNAAVEGPFTVYVGFTVDIDGSIRNVNVKVPSYKSITEEAIRVVSMFPKWRPAMRNNIPIRASYTIPIKFIID